jgi:hypothetical protein
MVQEVIEVNNVSFSYEDMLKLKNYFKTKKPGKGAFKGDGHGNWRNVLLEAQIKDIVDIDETVHNRLNELYKLPVIELTRAHIDEFTTIIKNLTFNKDACFKLIGDLLADRGQCDFHTLFILATMKRQGVDLRILLSNHDREFLKVWAAKFKFADNWELWNCPFDTLISNGREGQDESLQALGELLNRGLVTIDEINELVDVYIESLNLIDYQLSPDGQAIALIEHAPFAVTFYRELADALGDIKFDDSSTAQLAQSIDRMNAKYRQILTDNIEPADKHKLSKLLHKLTWNRWSFSSDDGMPADEQAQFTSVHNGYNVFYIHGHDGPHCVPKDKQHFVVSIDSHFAKSGINSTDPRYKHLILYHWDGGNLDINRINGDVAVAAASNVPATPVRPSVTTTNVLPPASSNSLLSSSNVSGNTSPPSLLSRIKAARAEGIPTTTPLTPLSGNHLLGQPSVKIGANNPVVSPSLGASNLSVTSLSGKVDDSKGVNPTLPLSVARTSSSVGNLVAAPCPGAASGKQVIDLKDNIDQDFVLNNLSAIPYENKMIKVQYQAMTNSQPNPNLQVTCETEKYQINIEQDALSAVGNNCNVYCFEVMMRTFKLNGEKNLTLDCENLPEEKVVALVKAAIKHDFVFELSSNIDLPQVLTKLEAPDLRKLINNIRVYNEPAKTDELSDMLRQEIARRTTAPGNNNHGVMFPARPSGSCATEVTSESSLNSPNPFGFGSGIK